MGDVSFQREYPRRLHHETPGWVKAGALFHVRLRVASENVRALTDPEHAGRLLEAAKYYHEHARWHCALVLLMPDHLHALLSFPADNAMNKTVGAWKRYATRELGMKWQVNFFDHRVRNDGEFGETWSYILRNPVAKGLCASEAEWPWKWMPTE